MGDWIMPSIQHVLSASSSSLITLFLHEASLLKNRSVVALTGKLLLMRMCVCVDVHTQNTCKLSATTSCYAHLEEPWCLSCALSRHCEPCKKSSWSQARNSQENSTWCGYPKSHLDHCCFMRKGLEFTPQQIPGPQSQLGGLVGGRWRNQIKICQYGLELTHHNFMPFLI